MSANMLKLKVFYFVFQQTVEKASLGLYSINKGGFSSMIGVKTLSINDIVCIRKLIRASP